MTSLLSKTGIALRTTGWKKEEDNLMISRKNSYDILRILAMTAVIVIHVSGN